MQLGRVGKSSSTGFLVTLDGPSGVGKTTCSYLLRDILTRSGFPATRTAQPSESPIGTLARSGTRTFQGLALSCLVAADRYHHIATVIEPELEAGRVVVCDRYVPSAFVLDELDGVPHPFIANLYRYARPADLAVFLLGDPEVCLRRAQERGVYSRFHHDDLAAAEHESTLFTETAERSRAGRTPTFIHHVAGADSEMVATTLAQQITTLLLSRSPSR